MRCLCHLVTILLGIHVLSASTPETKNLLFFIPANSTTTIDLSSTAGKGDDSLTPNAPDETIASYSGTIQASIGFDPLTLEIFEFNYTGGYVEVREATPLLQILPLMNYIAPPSPRPFAISRFSSVSNSPFYLGFTPSVINPPAAVIPGSGEIVGALRWVTNAGFERIYNGTTATVMHQEVINPATPLTKPHRGTPSIALTQIGETTFNRTIRTTLTYTFDEEERYGFFGSTDEVIVTETGSWSATKNFTLPTEYGQWAQDQGLNNPDPEDANEAGIPYVFLYALDLPEDTDSLPIRVVNTGGQRKVEIVLPAGGLKRAMTVEYSSNLTNGSWFPLTQFNYPGFDLTVLDVGATGSPRFTFPLPGRCFMRFVTTL